MRVVVYPHTLEIGGSQLNAVELAAGVRDLGHEVLVFGRPGALQHRIAELGLEFVESPPPHRRPSPRVMRALVGLVQERGVDVVHGYEWTTALEAYWGPRTRLGVPAVATVMSMAVAPFLPQDVPLVVGTEQIAAHEREAGRSLVDVIEPPVDVVHNAPDAVDPRGFLARHGIDDDRPRVVLVSRLAVELKLEGILAAVDAVAALATGTPDGGPAPRLIVVGDGPARAAVEERARAAAVQAGHDVVVLTGEMPDPREAYAAADVCLGMGGSALRAMAFGKPLVVQGERGFWQVLDRDSVDRFLWTGWYGVGDDPAAGPGRLEAALRPLLQDAGRRAALGGYSRELAVDRFSLTAAARRQLALYELALAEGARHGRLTAAGGRSAVQFARYEIARRVDRLRGSAAADDFNAVPVAAVAPARPQDPPTVPTESTTSEETLR